MAEASAVSISPVVGCAVCQSTARGLKLLDCLHVGCVDCLRANIRDDGTVACPAEGCQLITSLPPTSRFMGLESLPNTQLPPNQRQAASVCDDCPVDDTRSAMEKCLDCHMLLCSFHVESHRRSRRTRGHHLTDDLLGTIGSTISCRIHSSCEPVTYCVDCARLLCKRCLDLGVHKSHTHERMDKSAPSWRKKIGKLLDALQHEDTLGKNKTNLVRMGESIRKVDESAETHSEKVVKTKEDVLALLKKDEARNISKIDTVRWQKRQLLEAEEQTLKELVESVDRIVNFSREATTSFSDAELLEVVDVLDRSLTTARKKSQKMTEDLSAKEEKEPTLMEPGFKFSATWDNTESALACSGSESYRSAFPFHFDKSSHGNNLAISCSGLKATCTANTTAGSSVVGSVGFSSGHHRWSMLLDVLPTDTYPCTIHVGVTDEPRVLDSRQAWVWRTTGARKMKGASKWKSENGLACWKAGTVLTMEIRFISEKEALLDLWSSDSMDNSPFRFEIKTSSTNRKLYPYFYINYRQTITLLPCEKPELLLDQD